MYDMSGKAKAEQVVDLDQDQPFVELLSQMMRNGHMPKLNESCGRL
jgi:hypothetical protein